VREYYGHSLQGRDVGEWELLTDHLQLVEDYATLFAEKLNAEDWACLLARWHDLGKFDIRFQNYLLKENGFLAHLEGSDHGKVNHSSFGAQHAVDQFQGRELLFGYLLAYCIMGHHAGLPDYSDLNPDQKKASALIKRLQNAETRIPLDDIPEQIHQRQPLQMPAITFSNNQLAFQLGFWTRMLFSCLVDADYLATEAFMSPDRTRSRPQPFSHWKELSAELETHLNQKSNAPATPLQQIRKNILLTCQKAAECSPGFFSLTVPTGGGKTLSSLAFAVRHLEQYNKDRIIYAIPFTSIVEQTAGVFRDVFRDLPESTIIEHHYNVDPQQENYSSRLATENWDAPLIVTTNVQLLESLYSAKPSRCRKLHRYANSVIILDEAQTLPVEFLKPCLLALQELVNNYGCTIVLCTATQPAIHYSESFPIGLKSVCEIIPDPPALARQMQRVEVKFLGSTPLPDLVEKLDQHKQFLCIVNYKADAARVYRQLETLSGGSTEGLYHLSTNLCPEHRFQKFKEVRERLSTGQQPCRVVSTQLIEAGVDVDFPVVYRALAGLDSITQAAGRCNRNGKHDSADVYVFEPDGDGWSRLIGFQKQTAAITKGMLLDTNSPLHTTGWLAPETITQYFHQMYWSQSDRWDNKEILSSEMLCLSRNGIPEFKFREIAKRFHLIDDYQTPVFIRFNEEAENLLDQLRENLQDPDHKSAGQQRRMLLRKLQRYAVAVSDSVLKPMLGKDISILQNDRGEPTEYYELLNDNCYHEELGFYSHKSGLLGANQLNL